MKFFILLLTGLIMAQISHGQETQQSEYAEFFNQNTMRVDYFHSGFLIPELVPVGYEPRNQWGSTGSCVRGLCSKWFPDKGYGFLSFLRAVSENAWIHDARLPGSPWASVFCHINEVAGEVTGADLINGDTCLEFYIHESPQEEGGLVAQNVRLVQQ